MGATSSLGSGSAIHEPVMGTGHPRNEGRTAETKDQPPAELKIAAQEELKSTWTVAGTTISLHNTPERLEAFLDAGVICVNCFIIVDLWLRSARRYLGDPFARELGLCQKCCLAYQTWYMSYEYPCKEPKLANDGYTGLNGWVLVRIEGAFSRARIVHALRPQLMSNLGLASGIHEISFGVCHIRTEYLVVMMRHNHITRQGLRLMKYLFKFAPMNVLEDAARRGEGVAALDMFTKYRKFARSKGDILECKASIIADSIEAYSNWLTDPNVPERVRWTRYKESADLRPHESLAEKEEPCTYPAGSETSAQA